MKREKRAVVEPNGQLKLKARTGRGNAMSKSSPFILSLCLTLVAAVPVTGSASDKERTLLIRVKAAESKKLVTFSVSYQIEENQAPVELKSQSTPFKIRVKGNALKATFEKETGDPKMYVEVVQFEGDKQIGKVTGDGIKVEIEVEPNSDGSQMKVRSVE